MEAPLKVQNPFISYTVFSIANASLQKNAFKLSRSVSRYVLHLTTFWDYSSRGAVLMLKTFSCIHIHILSTFHSCLPGQGPQEGRTRGRWPRDTWLDVQGCFPHPEALSSPTAGLDSVPFPVLPRPSPSPLWMFLGELTSPSDRSLFTYKWSPKTSTNVSSGSSYHPPLIIFCSGF